MRSLKLERTDNNYKIEALIEENKKLKEFVREHSENDSGFSSSESSTGKPQSDTDSELSYDLGTSTTSLPDVVEELSACEKDFPVC